MTFLFSTLDYRSSFFPQGDSNGKGEFMQKAHRKAQQEGKARGPEHPRGAGNGVGTLCRQPGSVGRPPHVSGPTFLVL